jgi:5-methylcytosine-specific restriction enzyme subunit McrC
LNGFLIDMPRLFQDFVTVALREAIEGTYGGRVAAEPLHHLDEAGRVRLYPDLVWQVGGSAAAVIDAKYKAEKPRGYPNADLYQLLAYCTVLGLRTGHLVYARGNAEPAHHVVRGADVEVICHALDLGRAPDALLAEVRGLAAAIYGTWATDRSVSE